MSRDTAQSVFLEAVQELARFTVTVEELGMAPALTRGRVYACLEDDLVAPVSETSAVAGH
jgi:hypothetical protein